MWSDYSLTVQGPPICSWHAAPPNHLYLEEWLISDRWSIYQIYILNPPIIGRMSYPLESLMLQKLKASVTEWGPKGLLEELRAIISSASAVLLILAEPAGTSEPPEMLD